MSTSLGITQTADLEINPVFANGFHEYLQTSCTIASPQDLAKNSIIMTGGLLWDNSGSSLVLGILAEDTDATAADVEDAILYYDGEFSQDEVIATTTPVDAGVLPGNRLIKIKEVF
jgi:hypothetical protein